MRRTPLLVVAIAASLAACRPDTGRSTRDTAVIAVGEQATVPVPVLLSAKGRTADADVADLMFLRLAGLGAAHTTSGDDGFEPQLARKWTRRDSVTLAFDLDPRARWHDGAPVTAHDAVYSFSLARDSTFAPALAGLLRRVASVTAEDEHTLVVRFTEPYTEQMYDAVFHAPPLPAHLLERLPKESLAGAPFVHHPVGNGPYKWVRLEGPVLELAANDAFFLGAPHIKRVLFQVADGADARLNLLLTGEADALQSVTPPLANAERVTAAGTLRLVPVASNTLGYILFNMRDRRDSTRPHPILADTLVRRAIVLALDRESMVRAVLGPYGGVPYGPVSSTLWIAHDSPKAPGQDTAAARRLLAAAGWRDTDGNGVLDRGGRPLSLAISVPAQSVTRRQMALQAQEQLRAVGIAASVDVMEGAVQSSRAARGDFDLNFGGATQDPTPSGLTQSWSCHGGHNVSHFCDPVADSMMESAIGARDNGSAAWQAALKRIEADAPAAFVYSPVVVYAVSNRFDHVDIRPESSWITLWRWTVKDGEPLARDRATGR